MAEKLLTKAEAAEMLGLKNTRVFDRIRPNLIANQGLQMTRVSRSVRFTQSSLEKIIKNAIKDGTDIA